MNKRDLIIRVFIIFFGSLAVFLALFVFIFVFAKAVFSSGGTEIAAFLSLHNAGGIMTALIGSICLAVLSGIFGGFLGIGTAIALTFYVSNIRVKNFLAEILSLLAGFPSIIFGLVAYSLLIYRLQLQKSLFTAALTISCMILPFIAIRAMKILDENAKTAYFTSLSLGLGKNYIIRRLIIPLSFGELADCLAIGMFYGMGAVAPAMYTGAVMQTMGFPSLFKPFMSLPHHLYVMATSGFAETEAYEAAFVLLMLLLVIQLLVKLFISRREGAGWKKFRK